jgi:alpha-D-ribose 1-methylphosphonate 5-triphosphate synthase subunit PhnG
MYSCIDERQVVEMKDTFDTENPRKVWMGLLAKAPEGRVSQLLNAHLTRPGFTWLRAPEIGSTMVQGRAGGTGAPFNLGEVTVTRCALTLSTGEVGHAYIQGRSKADAEAAALVDAMMQTTQADDVRVAILSPLEAEGIARKTERAAKAAATKVDFFTMVRGDD